MTVSAASKAKTQVLEITEDVVTASKAYRVKNAAGFVPGDVVAFQDRGETAGYNRVTKIDGNSLYFENDFEQEVVDKNLIPQKLLATCEADIEVLWRGRGGAV